MAKRYECIANGFSQQQGFDLRKVTITAQAEHLGVQSLLLGHVRVKAQRLYHDVPHGRNP